MFQFSASHHTQNVVFLKEDASVNWFFILRFCSPGNILCKLCTPFALEHFLCLLSLLQRYHTHKVNLGTLQFAKLLSLQRKTLWLIFISQHWYTETRWKNKHINTAQTFRLEMYQPSKNSFPRTSWLTAKSKWPLSPVFLPTPKGQKRIRLNKASKTSHH